MGQTTTEAILNAVENSGSDQTMGTIAIIIIIVIAVYALIVWVMWLLLATAIRKGVRDGMKDVVKDLDIIAKNTKPKKKIQENEVPSESSDN
ncbi:MAG: hypothetical protein E7504_04270 [Ruminococcus sp.]|nr:hypothetical protein [Ruminococcus sp.]